MTVTVLGLSDETDLWLWLLSLDRPLGPNGGPAVRVGLWEAVAAGLGDPDDGELWAWTQHWGYHAIMMESDTGYAERFAAFPTPAGDPA